MLFGVMLHSQICKSCFWAVFKQCEDVSKAASADENPRDVSGFLCKAHRQGCQHRIPELTHDSTGLRHDAHQFHRESVNYNNWVMSRVDMTLVTDAYKTCKTIGETNTNQNNNHDATSRAA